MRIHSVYLIILCAVFASAAPVRAHDVGQSHLFIQVYDHSLEGRVEMTMNDLNLALGLDMPVEGDVTRDHLTPHIDKIHAYIREHLSMATGETRHTMRFTDHGILDVGFAKFGVVYYIIEGLPRVPEALDIDYTLLFEEDPEQQGFVVVEHNWYTGTLSNEEIPSLIFTPGETRQSLDLSNSTRFNGFLSFVGLGNWHISIGLDHILFLVALLLPAVLVRNEEGQWTSVERFRPALINVIKIITLFTIAHSVTLTLAGLDIVRLPGRLVESLIAISIAIAALNIIFPIFTDRMWLVIFGFGLFHGFGFAEVLTDLRLEGLNMAIALFGFNLGVELGQVLIICLVFPVLYLLRRQAFYSKIILKAGSAMLIMIAMYWSFERISGIDLHARAQFWQLIDVVLS